MLSSAAYHAFKGPFGLWVEEALNSMLDQRGSDVRGGYLTIEVSDIEPARLPPGLRPYYVMVNGRKAGQ